MEVRRDRQRQSKGTLLRGPVITFLLSGLIATFILIAIGAVTMYFIQRDYYRRVNATEAMKYGQAVASAVSEFHALNNRFPIDINDLRLLPERPLYVQDIGVDKNSGVLYVQVADVPDSEDMLEFRPTVESGGQLVYSCMSVNIPDEFLPSACMRVNIGVIRN